MPTASIHYHPASSEPEFVLIDGVRSNILPGDYAGTGSDTVRTGARIAAIDHACRRIGWKVADAAAIVRQADGRGTIRIEPADPAGPNAYLVVGSTGIPQAVIVGDKAEPVHTICSLTSALPGNATRAAQAVHVAFAAIGYSPVTPLPVTPGKHQMYAVADSDLPDMTAGLPADPAEWRDVPTMVRIDDIARLLTLTAERIAEAIDAELVRYANGF